LAFSETTSEKLMATGIDIRHLNVRIVLASLVFLAGSVSAQTQAPSLNLQLPQQSDARTALDEDVAKPDEYAADTATSVHGSFTTGVGYSKTYGNSTFNAAELDVNKQYDSGRTLNLHIDVLRSTGMPLGPPRDYVTRYPGY
jgi:hypothetical protein